MPGKRKAAASTPSKETSSSSPTADTPSRDFKMELRQKTPVEYVPESKKKKSPGSAQSSGGRKKARKTEEEPVAIKANRKVVDILKALAQVYRIRGEQGKADDYNHAAKHVQEMQEEVKNGDMLAGTDFKEPVPAIVEEFLQNGEVQRLNELRAETAAP